MKYTEKEVLQFVKENDVKFVKLEFCDIFGVLRSISIIAERLPEVFRKGLVFDAAKVSGFMNFFSTDLLLYPDPDTLALLPWRPQQGRVVRFFCTIRYPDGAIFEGDGRSFLSHAVDYARSNGYNFRLGTSCEFYVFRKSDDDTITKIPHDNGGYCDTAPADRGENLRRDICLALEQMDIYPESSRHESGPGQNEIEFRCANALHAADNLVTFKNVVRSVADRSGLYATFVPKPLSGQPGSGLHVRLYCMKGTQNIFVPKMGALTPEAASMTAGILRRIRDITLFLNSTPGSYRRLGNSRAPKYITWSHENYAQLIRVPLSEDEENALILRSPDNTCNPYFALGLIIYAALEGAMTGAELGEPYCGSREGQDSLNGTERLPETLEAAINAAKDSEFLRERLPDELVDHMVRVKTAEAKEYADSSDKQMFETERYFYKM
ncbi:MAG: glutamine synthetase [Ruminococcus sp.]|nr:glutamine synthetase [Ruminococcus sp.]